MRPIIALSLAALPASRVRTRMCRSRNCSSVTALGASTSRSCPTMILLTSKIARSRVCTSCCRLPLDSAAPDGAELWAACAPAE